MAAAPPQVSNQSKAIQKVAQAAAQAVPNQAPALPAQPVGEPFVGGNISITPGQIIFTEYKARVFNQTEAMYKTTGYLGISLFEDSYGLSKKTAQVVVTSVPLSGTLTAINQFATNTYRTVLGIAAPTPPPPPPPDPVVSTGTPTGGNTTTGPVSVGPTKGNPVAVSVATTPTSFTSPTTVAPITSVGANLSNVPTTLVAQTSNSGGSGRNIPSSNSFSPATGGGLGTPAMGGGKIICNELYRQGFLSEEMWNADEKYGEMMFEKDPKLVIGYQMWARKVVKFMKENPNNTKMAYWLFKPWTEYMGYKMGVVEKPTLRGRFTNWIGSQFSYMVFDLYNGKRLLDKYNYKVFKSENNIPTYKMA